MRKRATKRENKEKKTKKAIFYISNKIRKSLFFYNEEIIKQNCAKSGPKKSRKRQI